MATELYTEEWRPVVGFEGIYEVSSCGRIRRVANGHGAVAGRMLSPNPNKKGYLRACLCRDGKAKQGRVHTLVAEAFIGPRPEGCEVDHIDGNRQNNHVSNLRWVTPKENIRASLARNGGRPGLRGIKNGQSKLNEMQVRLVRFIYDMNADHGCKILLARIWNVGRSCVYEIASGNQRKFG